MPTPHLFGRANLKARIMAPLLAAATLAIAPGARAEITPQAEKVVARYLEAIGGPQVVRDVKSTHIKANIAAFGLKGTTEIWARYPDHRATSTEIGPIKLLTGYDGTTGWRTDPTGKVSTLDGKDLEEAKAEAYFDGDRWLLEDQGGGKVAKVEDAEADKDWVVLEVTPPAGRPRRLWFDAKTGLLGKSVSKHDQQTVVNTFSDYRPVTIEGSKPRQIAFTQRTEVVGMAANSVDVKLDLVEMNAAVDDARFAPPTAVADVVTYLKTPGVAQLPFVYASRHVWLRASVNGQPPADFLYDTGASITVIDSTYAASIGLERQGSLQSQGAGAAGSASLSTLQTLRVENGGDGVEMKDQRVAILSVNPFLAPFFWRDCAGIIGYDFITRFVNEIDFDNQKLTLRDPKTFKYEGAGAAIPMKLAGTVPVVTMKLDDQFEGEFRLDVGSSSTVDLHTPFVNKHGLREKAHPAVVAMGGGFGGMFTSTITRMKKLSIGPYSWSDPLVSLSSTTTGALASEDYAGNVGNQILERFKCTFDYDHKTVYLDPGKKYARRDQFSRSGTLLAKLGDTVKAMQVLKGSPAEKAGIQQGDVILAVDGKPVASWEAEELRTIFEERPVGSKIKFEILRDGKKKTATVKLADML